MIPLLLAACLAGAVVLVLFGISRPPEIDTAAFVEERLKEYEGVKPLSLDELELQRPFVDRFLRPAISKLGAALSRSTPIKARDDLLHKLELAGRPYNLTPEDFGVVRIIVAVLGAILGFLIGLLVGSVTLLVMFLAGLALLGYFMPVLWLQQLVDRKRTEIQKALPDALDLLVITVDAGLGFDAALDRVTGKYRNALSDKFAQMLREVSLGRPRQEAMDEMGRTAGVDDLHNFVQAVIQSEQFGTGIGKILRIQADEMRRKRRQRAQQLGAQATLKMMLPMIGCIFPTLWIILLGPALLIVMKPR